MRLVVFAIYIEITIVLKFHAESLLYKNNK